MSNDEYQHQDFWTEVVKKLNEEQESVCVQSNEKGECLMSMKWMMLDLSETPNIKEQHVNKNI